MSAAVQLPHNTASDDAAHGRHVLLTLTGCRAEILDDRAGLEDLVRRAAAATGATVLQVVSHQFTPHGITALALLAESHASLHTYPERGLAFWDCFTCGVSCEPTKSIAVLIDTLRPLRVERQEIRRCASAPD